MTPFDPDVSWQTITGDWPQGGWFGYVGRWQTFSDNKERSWDGARIFGNLDGENFCQVNVYSEAVMTSSPGELRPQDGNFEKRWEFNLQEAKQPDGFWHSYLPKDGPLRGRVLGIGPGRTATLTFSLPVTQAHGPQPAVPFWNAELFVRQPGSKRSWSGGVGYDLKSGKRQTVFLIRELAVREDPSGPLQLSGRTWEPRPRLPESPAAWPPAAGGWAGTSQQLVWDAGGRMAVTKEQPVEWSSPLDMQTVTRLPDGMYVSSPDSVPLTLDDVPSEGVQIEFGGLAEDQCFVRTVLHYGADGGIASVRWDQFLAPG